MGSLTAVRDQIKQNPQQLVGRETIDQICRGSGKRVSVLKKGSEAVRREKALFSSG